MNLPIITYLIFKYPKPSGMLLKTMHCEKTIALIKNNLFIIRISIVKHTENYLDYLINTLELTIRLKILNYNNRYSNVYIKKYYLLKF